MAQSATAGSLPEACKNDFTHKVATLRGKDIVTGEEFLEVNNGNGARKMHYYTTVVKNHTGTC